MISADELHLYSYKVIHRLVVSLSTMVKIGDRREEEISYKKMDNYIFFD